MQKLKFAMPPTGRHRHAEQQQMLNDIWKFLDSRQWAVAETNAPVQVTWLELRILYDLSGCNTLQCRQRMVDDHRQAVARGDRRAVRWQKIIAGRMHNRDAAPRSMQHNRIT